MERMGILKKSFILKISLNIYIEKIGDKPKKGG